ncbi:cytochrome P450 [Glaciihabitans sp. UYNi722]|uniref:cytochrome P450 n=1 Tax=Glaciihabitans sp. UYNi722 TaxID=3156344 RepID=UPI003399ADFF
MVNDDSEGGRLRDEQIVSNAIILLIAGHETTVNAITNGILLFLRNPEQLALVRENPGLHYCFGAPLARLEGLVALNAWLARVKNPRLVQDPPPYRRNAALRGPSELLVDFDTID